MADVLVSPSHAARTLARRSSGGVPDFQKLHEIEDARLAKWKKSNRTTITTPLPFRLSTRPSTAASALAGNKNDEQKDISTPLSPSNASNPPPSTNPPKQHAAERDNPLSVFAPAKIQTLNRKNAALENNNNNNNNENNKISSARGGAGGKMGGRERIPLSARREEEVSGATIDVALDLLQKIDFALDGGVSTIENENNNNNNNNNTNVDSFSSVNTNATNNTTVMASKRYSAFTAEANWKSSPTQSRRAPVPSPIQTSNNNNNNNNNNGGDNVNDKENRFSSGGTARRTITSPATNARMHRDNINNNNNNNGEADNNNKGKDDEAAGGGGGVRRVINVGNATPSTTTTTRPSSSRSRASTAPEDIKNNINNNNNNNNNNVSTPSSSSSSSSRVDLARLKRMLSRLEPKQKQSFNSSEFYVFGRVLGEGAYGKVKIATHLLTSEKVAVKTFEKSKLADPNSRRRVTREIRILKALSHPNVIRLFEVIDCPTRKYIIMELATGGDLCKYVRENRRLSEAEACRLFSQIVDGLLYCHRSGIVHRDVKLDNILMDEQKNIKIVDFGFSVNFKQGQKLRKACGSPSYAAPEIVSRKPYNPPDVDVWSLGVVLYAMICGYFPFQGSNTQDLCRKIMKGRYETPEWMSPEAKDLIRHMLVLDPSQRASMDFVQQHPWCKSALSLTQVISSSSSNNSNNAAAGGSLSMLASTPLPLHDVDFEKSEDSQDGDRPCVMDANMEIVREMTEMGFPHDYSLHCVTRNLHNIASTSYWLLQHKKVLKHGNIGNSTSSSSATTTTIV